MLVLLYHLKQLKELYNLQLIVSKSVSLAMDINLKIYNTVLEFYHVFRV